MFKTNNQSCKALYKRKFSPDNYNILIIEDSKSVNKILSSTFSVQGFNCFSAYSLKEARELLENEDVHYIMLDINLPDGNGYEIINELEGSSKKIFVLTNENDEQLRTMAYQKGIIDFIVKDKNFFHKIHQITKTIEQFEKNKFKTVLVVDDSFVIQQQLKDILQNRFYDVKTASDTKTALEIISNEVIDLMLLDIQLKESNGVEFLQEYNHEIINIKKIPVLIISGHIEYSTIRDGLKAGAKDIIRKPYVIEEIVLKVDLWIDYKRKEDEIACSTKLLEEYKEAVDGNALVSKTDVNGILTYANDKFIALSGFKEEELIGKNHNIVRHPDMPKEVFKEMWHTIKTLKKPWHGKVVNLTKDGEPYWVNAYIKPIIDEKGNIVEFIGIRNDVTELQLAKKEIETIHKQTKSSIEYASLIQNAIVPDDTIFPNYFSEFFTLWDPKDVVGGDIYLFDELRNEDECLLMVIDCTGHGVPGAFVTMLVKAIERQIVSHINSSNDNIVSPSEILSFFNENIKKVLKNQDNSSSFGDAGFDGSILYYNKKDKQIKFSSANSLMVYYDENGEYNIIKGDRHSVGYKSSKIDYEFTEHLIDTKDNMKFYLTTDGYIDQNGGEKGHCFGKKRFKKLLDSCKDDSFSKQKEILVKNIEDYKKDEDRNDDITVIGFKI